MISSIIPQNVKLYFNPERTSLLTQVFKKTVIETAVTAVIFCASVFFISTGAGVVILASSMTAILLFNASIRITIAELIYQNKHNPSHAKQVAIDALNYVAPYTFGIITSGSSDVLIHEAGHAIAASALFKNASPSITIDPYNGGATNFFISGLTELGKKIGFRNSDIAVTAAGAGLGVAVSAITFTGSLFLQESHPELSKYLLFSSIFNILNHALYALSALWTPLTETSHDFVYLGLHGISPILCTAVIIAIPIAIKLAFVGGYYLHRAVFNPVNAVAA